MVFGTWLKGLAGLISNSVQLANTPPVPEGTVSAVGAGNKAARNDHVHQRLSSTQWGTLNASGEVTFNFTRSFTAEPGICATYKEAAGNLPMLSKVKSWVTDGSGNYTGVTLKFYRLQLLPSNLTVLVSLQNFDVSAGANLTGISVSCIAVQQST